MGQSFGAARLRRFGLLPRRGVCPAAASGAKRRPRAAAVFVLTRAARAARSACAPRQRQVGSSTVCRQPDRCRAGGAPRAASSGPLARRLAITRHCLCYDRAGVVAFWCAGPQRTPPGQLPPPVNAWCGGLDCMTGWHAPFRTPNSHGPSSVLLHWQARLLRGTEPPPPPRGRSNRLASGLLTAGRIEKKTCTLRICHISTPAADAGVSRQMRRSARHPQKGSAAPSACPFRCRVPPVNVPCAGSLQTRHALGRIAWHRIAFELLLDSRQTPLRTMAKRAHTHTTYPGRSSEAAFFLAVPEPPCVGFLRAGAALPQASS